MPAYRFVIDSCATQERSVWQAVRVIRNVRAFTTTMGFNLVYHFWLGGKRQR